MPPSRLHRYCRQCRFDLFGLTKFRCQECGRPFDPKDPGTTLAGPNGFLRFEKIATPILIGFNFLAVMVVLSSSHRGMMGNARILDACLVAAAIGLAVVYALRLIFRTKQIGWITLGLLACLSQGFYVWVWINYFYNGFLRYFRM